MSEVTNALVLVEQNIGERMLDESDAVACASARSLIAELVVELDDAYTQEWYTLHEAELREEKQGLKG